MHPPPPFNHPQPAVPELCPLCRQPLPRPAPVRSGTQPNVPEALRDRFTYGFRIFPDTLDDPGVE
jgi:hypothetical protein